jgi:hypothetical protein
MHPAHDGGVRHRLAAVGHHLHQISKAKLEAQIPSHRMMIAQSMWRPSNSSSKPGNPVIASYPAH